VTKRDLKSVLQHFLSCTRFVLRLKAADQVADTAPRLVVRYRTPAPTPCPEIRNDVLVSPRLPTIWA
jgi:hypothetical protein